MAQASTLADNKPSDSCHTLTKTETPTQQPRAHKFNPAQLLPGERYWRDHQPWLESKGYMLRPRYHPEWAPSFTLDDFAKYEDGFCLNVSAFSFTYKCSYMTVVLFNSVQLS